MHKKMLKVQNDRLFSGRPISLFPYRPIPIITDISDFHIGRYRCRYRYGNCHIGRYRCRYRYGNYTYSKCNKMQFCGKKVIFFFNFPNFSGIDFYKSILGISFGGILMNFCIKQSLNPSTEIPIVYRSYIADMSSKIGRYRYPADMGIFHIGRSD